MELLIMTVFSVLIFTFLVVIPFFPPLVYFHSRVVCQNQSLFTSGKVCLNLLNTYSGSGSELWCPHISTILQVLVSIQGLVLTENPGLILAKTPFLAQPVVWKPTPLEKSLSQKHNKDYFTKSLLLMEQIIRRPPKV